MYRYEDLKPKIFAEENQKDFIKIREDVYKLLKMAGCFKIAMVNFSGDGWLKLAMIDRLVELGEIKEIKYDDDSFAQDRIFVINNWIGVE